MANYRSIPEMPPGLSDALKAAAQVEGGNKARVRAIDEVMARYKSRYQSFFKGAAATDGDGSN